MMYKKKKKGWVGAIFQLLALISILNFDHLQDFNRYLNSNFFYRWYLQLLKKLHE